MDEYDLGGITPERLARLNPEQRSIVLQREAERQERMKMFDALDTKDPDNAQQLQDYLRDIDKDYCEHGRSIWKHCGACGEIDHVLFPELYDEDGFLHES